MICTYLHQNQHTEPTSNEAINTVLAQVREVTRKDWRVAELAFERTHWFRKSVTVYRYELLLHICSGEFQTINFHRDDTNWSINTTVPAELVLAFLYGVLAGRNAGGFTKRENHHRSALAKIAKDVLAIGRAETVGDCIKVARHVEAIANTALSTQP